MCRLSLQIEGRTVGILVRGKRIIEVVGADLSELPSLLAREGLAISVAADPEASPDLEIDLALDDVLRESVEEPEVFSKRVRQTSKVDVSELQRSFTQSSLGITPPAAEDSPSAESDDEEEALVELEIDEQVHGVMWIGRAPSCDVLLDDGSISRRHCQICTDRLGVTVIDNNATNGCFVNGVRVHRSPLAHDDFLQLGTLKMRVLFKRKTRPEDDNATLEATMVVPTDALPMRPHPSSRRST